MKKILTVLMAAAMLLAFSACGGSSGDKADPNLGEYMGHQVKILDWQPLSEVLDEGETSVELKSGGKGVMYLDGKSMDLTWKVDGDKLTLTSEKVDSTGTVQDGVIKLDSFFGMDWPMTFVKDGVTPPDRNKEGDSSAASSADASAK